MNKKRIMPFVFLLAAVPLLALAAGQEPTPATPAPSPEKWQVSQVRGKPRTIEFTTDEGTWMSVDVSPDARTVVFDLVGEIYLLPIGGGQARPISKDSGLAINFHPRFSPDGKRIAFISDRSGQDNVWVMDVDGGNPRQVSDQKEDRMALPTWTPDGDYLIVRRGGDANVRGRGDLWLYHVDGGKGIQLTPDSVSASWPSVAPDGRTVYFEAVNQNIEDAARGRYQIRRLDRQTGEILEITGGTQPGRDGGAGQLSSGGACAPEVSPDGRWLAFARRLADGTAVYKGHEYGPRTALWIRDLKLGGERILMDPITPDAQERNNIGPLPRYAWMPDGQSIVITEGGKFRRVYLTSGQIETIPFTAQVVEKISEKVYAPRRVSDDSLAVGFLRWPVLSPDGRWLAFQAIGHIWLMEMPNGQPRRLTDASFKPHEYAPAWSPDGQWIAFTSWSDDEYGHVWKARPGGGSPIRLTEEAAEYLNPAWSPDDERIVVVRSSGAMARGRMPAENLWYELRWLPVSGGASHYIVTVAAPQNDFLRGHIAEPVFGPEGRLFYLEQKREGDKRFSQLVSIRLDGLDKRAHVRFRFADQAAPSPGGRWVGFQEGDNLYLCPLPWPGAAGEPVEIDRRDSKLPIKELSQQGGNFPRWLDSDTLQWGSGNWFFTYNGKTEKTSSTEIRLAVPRSLPVGTVALLGARIITMAGDQIIERGDLVVRNGRIAAVGQSGQVRIPPEAYRVDVRGKTIIPGLIDVHLHAHRDAAGIVAQRNWEMAANLAYGVTSALDPAAWAQNVFTTAELIEAGAMRGPRVFSTGPTLSGGDGARRDRVENLDDARRLVKRIKSYGATTIKQYQQPRREQRQMLVEAAREAGLMVTSEGDADPLFCIGLTMDGHTGFEHPILAVPLYRDVTEFLGQAGVFYSPTFVVGGPGPWSEDYFYQESEIWKNEKLRRFTPWRKLEVHTRRRMLRPVTDYPFPLVAQGLADIIRAGGYGAIGAHGQQQGIASHFEIWALASAMPALEALRVATLHGAMMIGIQQDVGSLEVGKLADLVVLNANPLENIRNTTNIRYVMKAGKLYDGDRLDELWPAQEPFGDFYWRQKGARPD